MPLIMRAWHFGAPLKAGQWGIREPMPEAPEVAPDILIVPLAAFDRAGHRIGYGAGYYDMTINALRAKKKVIAIGIAFAAQEIPKVPATDRDARLDLVLTERETIDFRDAHDPKVEPVFDSHAQDNACAFSSSATWSAAPGAQSSSSGCPA